MIAKCYKEGNANSSKLEGCTVALSVVSQEKMIKLTFQTVFISTSVKGLGWTEYCLEKETLELRQHNGRVFLCCYCSFWDLLTLSVKFMEESEILNVQVKRD